MRLLRLTIGHPDGMSEVKLHRHRKASAFERGKVVWLPPGSSRTFLGEKSTPKNQTGLKTQI